jgi:ribonuclease G
MVCEGKGRLKSAETVCYEIFREISRIGITYDTNALLILAAQPVVDRMLDELSSIVAQLEDSIKKTIKCQVENLYHQEQYDVVQL